MAEEEKKEVEKDELQLKDMFLKVNGKCMLTRELLKDHSYTIKIPVMIDGKNEKSNKDGKTFNLYFSGEMDGVGEIINTYGKRIQTESRQTQSQKLRFQIYHYNDVDGMSDQDFYDYIMTKFRHFLPQLIELVRKWDKSK